MSIILNEDNYFIIQLLSYDKPTESTERFYFAEMSTLQATTLIDPNRNIIFSELCAYTEENEYLDDETIKTFKTIKDFNDFFIHKPQYYIHNCEITLENGLKIRSHDDGEVSIQFAESDLDFIIIEIIFEKYNLDKKLIEILKNKPEHYVKIDNQSNIINDFENFDDYIENGRN